MTDYADLATIEALIGTMEEGDLLCRVYRHTMRPMGLIFNEALNYWTETQRCSRCELEMTFEVDSHGNVLSRLPLYRDGYLLKGVGRPDPAGRSAIRVAAMTALYKGKTETVMGMQGRVMQPRSRITREALGLEPVSPTKAPAVVAAVSPATSAPSRKTAAKKVPATKVTAKKTTARKVAARKVPARAVAAKKTTSRRRAS